MKLTKRYKTNAKLVETARLYSIEEALGILKTAVPTKFDSSVDLQLKLTADPTASDQVIRGTTSLPHGTGKQVRVVVLTKDEAGQAAKAAGADEVGGDELVQRILQGWMEFDVVVASPGMMRDIAKLGRVLGPRGLMPSPKAGTVTDDLPGTVAEIKKGRIEIKMDKQSNLHASVGRLSFDAASLAANTRALLHAVLAAKPKGVKGNLLKKAHLSSTMGPGLGISLQEFTVETEE